jgi:hypothetical protein
MVSGHRASFRVSRAAPCGGPARLARQEWPGNEVLPPPDGSSPCTIVAANGRRTSPLPPHVRLNCIRQATQRAQRLTTPIRQRPTTTAGHTLLGMCER